MAAKAKLKRKSYFVDERALNRAKKALGVKTEAEVIRLSVERVAEMEEFWEFMTLRSSVVLLISTGLVSATNLLYNISIARGLGAAGFGHAAQIFPAPGRRAPEGYSRPGIGSV